MDYLLGDSPKSEFRISQVLLTLGEGSNCVGCVLGLFFHYSDDYVFLSFIDFLGDIGIFPQKKFKCKFGIFFFFAQGIFFGGNQ